MWQTTVRFCEVGFPKPIGMLPWALGIPTQIPCAGPEHSFVCPRNGSQTACTLVPRTTVRLMGCSPSSPVCGPVSLRQDSRGPLSSYRVWSIPGWLANTDRIHNAARLRWRTCGDRSSSRFCAGVWIWGFRSRFPGQSGQCHRNWCPPTLKCENSLGLICPTLRVDVQRKATVLKVNRHERRLAVSYRARGSHV